MPGEVHLRGGGGGRYSIDDAAEVRSVAAAHSHRRSPSVCPGHGNPGRSGLSTTRLRAEIEAIPGVQSGEVLRQLIERDLVRIVGRSEELGRPFLYGTTKHFLQVFELKHLMTASGQHVAKPFQPFQLWKGD